MSLCWFGFIVFPAGLLVAFWKTTEPPAAFLPHTQHANAVPVKFHNCNESVMRVAGKLRVPTMRSRDIMHQAKGGSSWSSPLRSDGSRGDQAGEAGPVEPSSAKAKSLCSGPWKAVPDHNGGRPIEVNACILITHMVYL